MRHPQRSFLAGFLLALFLSVGISFAAPAFAQDVDLESFAELAGFSTSASITVIIARLIRTAISLVGVIAVSFFIYGGFMWMTAGGSADKISSAKKILTNSIIGIVLVFSSFAIVSFLLGALVGSSDGSVSSSSSGSSSYSDSSSSSLFYLSSVNTDCSESLQNLELQFVFTKSVDDDALDSGGISVTAAGGSEVAGTFDRSGRTVTFTPEQTCEELGYSDYFCFDAETSYSIALDSTILESGTGSSLSCSDEYPCSFSFTTGTGIDLNDPSVSIDSPDDGSSVVVGDIEMIQAQTADDTGVSTVYFYVVDDDDAVYASGVDFSSAGELLGGDDLNFFFTDEAEEWDSSGYTTNETYDVWAKGVDCAGNSDTASKVEIVLRAVNCSNGILDAEYEDDVDCGGDSSSEYYCGACEGGSCEESSECASGRCEEGECVDSPKISSVSPGDGAVGNLITISGEGFGDDTGVVTFLGTESGDELEVSSYVCDGTTQWSDDEVIIQVPSGVVDGPIQIQNIDGDSERTDDDYGATISDFDANAIQRPGICLLDPSTDTVGESVAVSGIGFGDTQGTSTFYFTGYETSSYVSWDDEGLDVVVPNANAGTYRTSVFTGDYQCTDESGEATGSSCAADSDCDEEAGETCGGTSWCSETLELCSDDDDCGEDGGTCESLRVGSNKVQFVVTDTSSDSTPIISVVNSGWQACDGGTEDSESCSTDDDCGGGGTCEDALNWGPS